MMFQTRSLISFSFLSSFFLILTTFKPSTSSSILIFHAGGTSSHRTAMWPLTERLANAGHQITYVFPISKRFGSHPNVEEISPKELTLEIDRFMGDFDINFRINNSILDRTQEAIVKSVEFCEKFYDSPETKEWLGRSNLHYDLIMIDSTFGQCALGLVHKFNAKLIIFNPVTNFCLWDAYGVVPEASSLPEFIGNPKPFEMTLWSRIMTTLAYGFWRLAEYYFAFKVEPIVKQKLDLKDMPSLVDIGRNASLVFLNSHFVEDYPMSLPPMFVSFSGLWCSQKYIDEVKPLPEELENFIQDSDFIYVSFGSSVVVSTMPIRHLTQFFKTFRTFSNIKFLWRWTGEIPKNKPKNVIMQPWFPQRDVLAHPKIKGFIMQAGRPSSQEALCFGVPMIVFPIVGDQDFNANRLEYIGAALIHEIRTIRAASLIKSLHEILENKKYTMK